MLMVFYMVVIIWPTWFINSNRPTNDKDNRLLTIEANPIKLILHGYCSD